MAPSSGRYSNPLFVYQGRSIPLGTANAFLTPHSISQHNERLASSLRSNKEQPAWGHLSNLCPRRSNRESPRSAPVLERHFYCGDCIRSPESSRSDFFFSSTSFRTQKLSRVQRPMPGKSSS